MIATPRPPGFVIKGWHVLAGFLLFFGVDIAVNAYFMVAAYRTFPGETSLTPYEDGVAYNATLRQMRAQSALGWRLSVGADGAGRLVARVADAGGAPLSGLAVTAHLERPATQAGERDIGLSASSGGDYVAQVGPLGGAWDVDLTVRDGQGRVAKAERRLTLP